MKSSPAPGFLQMSLQCAGFQVVMLCVDLSHRQELEIETSIAQDRYGPLPGFERLLL